MISMAEGCNHYHLLLVFALSLSRTLEPLVVTGRKRAAHLFHRHNLKICKSSYLLYYCRLIHHINFYNLSQAFIIHILVSSSCTNRTHQCLVRCQLSATVSSKNCHRLRLARCYAAFFPCMRYYTCSSSL
jgi:hypothetical protein